MTYVFNKIGTNIYNFFKCRINFQKVTFYSVDEKRKKAHIEYALHLE